jgi:hypothetical protein
MKIGKWIKARTQAAAPDGGAKSKTVKSASVKTLKNSELKGVPLRATRNVRSHASPASPPAKTRTPTKTDRQPLLGAGRSEEE